MADPLSLPILSNAFADLAAGVAPAIVTVRSHQALSSGFVWRPGLIVTADEALAEDGDITVITSGGERHTATIAGRDPGTDIALLRIEDTTAQPVRLSTEAARPGGLALLAGAADGGPLLAMGMIAHIGPAWRSLRGGQIDARIELDIRPRRQAEGGLVLDAAGAGIGMAVFGPRRRVLVIPGATIDRVAARLAADGRIPRGYLGLGLRPVRLDDGKGMGVMVMNVDPRGPGATADIRQGDIVISKQGNPVGRIGDLIRSLDGDSVGQVLTLGIRRGGATLETRVTVGERAAG